MFQSQNAMRRLVTTAALVALAAFAAGCGSRPVDVPGVVRQEGNGYLVENNSTAYLVWHALGVRKKTLVHLDTHDDCRYIPQEKLEKLNTLAAEGNYNEIFRRSDINGFTRFDIPEAELLYDLGNFIYPCIADGTIGTFYWVCPDRRFNDAAKRRLQQHLRIALRQPKLKDMEDLGDYGFSFRLLGVPVIVTTLDGLPQQSSGCLLDLDTDFFAFSYAMSDDHLRDRLVWNPQDVCRILQGKVPYPSSVVVCASTWGGYLPLLLRFIPDACFDALVHGTYPPSAKSLLKAAEALRRSAPDVEVPTVQDVPHYRAARQFMLACTELARGRSSVALKQIETAAGLVEVYTKGLLDAAEILLAVGATEDSERFIHRFEELMGGETVTSVRFRIEVLLKANRLADADHLSHKLLNWSRNADDLILRALILERSGQRDEAIELYREALRRKPMKAHLHHNIAVLLAAIGEKDEAMKHYRDAIRLQPDFVDSRNNLGVLLLGAGNFTAAIEQYRHALEIRPRDAIVHNNLGFALQTTGKFDAALSHYASALELRPKYPEALINKGRVLSVMFKHEDAIVQFRKALELEPGSPDAYCGLAVALQGAGRRDDAIKHFRKALGLRPNWTEARALLDEALGLDGPGL